MNFTEAAKASASRLAFALLRVTLASAAADGLSAGPPFG